jgi:hypothetical protein|tara:strand:- start:2272 stop:2805 length:534 start_codon:yes stop_codon:yes gene_type:complete
MGNFSQRNFKFFTILWFIVFGINISSVSAQVILRNTESGKIKEIPFGAKIFYRLHSDSILPVQITKESGILQTTGDSTFVFMDQSEITVSDVSYIEIESIRLKKWRSFIGPVLIAGSGALIRGLTMWLGEGNESKNKETIPLYIGIGGTVSIVAAIPFLCENKSFDLNNSKWELLIP